MYMDVFLIILQTWKWKKIIQAIGGYAFDRLDFLNKAIHSYITAKRALKS